MLLENDQLDDTRLESAGISKPNLEKDFENGYLQSKDYLKEYLENEDKNSNILEIGSSWGYFLKSIGDSEVYLRGRNK